MPLTATISKVKRLLQAMQEQAWELNLDSSEGLRPEKKQKIEKSFKV